MEQINKNRALMQALAPKEPRRLPSNFAYLTMRRIQEKQRQEERRQHTVAIATTVGVSLVGILTFFFLFWDVLWNSFASIFSHPHALALVLPTLFCLLFFALVNHWLSRQYRGLKNLH